MVKRYVTQNDFNFEKYYVLHGESLKCFAIDFKRCNFYLIYNRAERIFYCRTQSYFIMHSKSEQLSNFEMDKNEKCRIINMELSPGIDTRKEHVMYFCNKIFP